MADTKISALPAQTTLATNDVLPLVSTDNSQTRKITAANAATGLTKLGLSVGTATPGSPYTGQPWIDINSTPVLKLYSGSQWNSLLLSGSIANADVASNAAIAGTKISPDFGSQTVTTTGIISAAAGNASAPSVTITGDTNTGLWAPAADTLAVSTGGTERLRVDSSGRTLVGASSSTDLAGVLQIRNDAGNNTQLFRSSADANGPCLNLTKSRGTAGTPLEVSSGDELGIVRFRGHDGAAWQTAAQIQGIADGSWTDGGDTSDNPGALLFSTTADGASTPTERMRIDSAGNIRISATGSAASPAINWLNDGDTGIYSPNSNSIGLVTAGVERVTIGSAGAVVSSFAITNNEAWLFNNTNTGTNYSLSFRTNNVQRGYINVTDSAVAYNTSSDYRLKENITPVADGITRLQQLKPSRFNFIVEPDRIVDGFLAHEVQEVVPEAISGEKDAVDEDGNPIYQGIDQSKLVPLLTAALQEAVARIESLEAEVAALKAA